MKDEKKVKLLAMIMILIIIIGFWYTVFESNHYLAFLFTVGTVLFMVLATLATYIIIGGSDE